MAALSEEVVKILSVDTGNSEKSLAQLRSEVKVLRSELLNLDTSTEEYNQVLRAAADRMKTLSDQSYMLRTSATDLGSYFTTIVKMGKGIAGGFAAAQGAMALFGSESEELTNVLKKTQGAIAIVSGLQGLEGLTKTLKSAKIQFNAAKLSAIAFSKSLTGLKAALISTGIGALVVGIGMLIANWDKVTKLFKDTSATDAAREALEKLNNTIEESETQLKDKNIDAIVKYAEALNEAAGDVKKIDAATKEYTKTLNENKKAQLEAQLVESKRALLLAQTAYNKKKNKENKEILNEAKESYKKIEQALKEHNASVLLETAKANSNQAKENATARQKELTAEKAFQESRINMIKELNKQSAEIELSYRGAAALDKYIGNILTSTKSLTEAQKEYNEELKKIEVKEINNNIQYLNQSLNNSIKSYKKLKAIKNPTEEQRRDIEKTRLEVRKLLNEVESAWNKRIVIDLEVKKEKVDWFENLVQQAKNYRDIFEPLKSESRAAFDELRYNFDDFKKMIKENMGNVSDEFINQWKKVPDKLRDIWVKMTPEMSTEFLNLPQEFLKEWAAVPNEVKKYFGEVENAINFKVDDSFVKEVEEYLKTISKDVEVANGTFKINVDNSFVKEIDDDLNTVFKKIDDINGEIKVTVDKSFVKELEDDFDNISDKAKETFRQLPKELQAFLSNMPTGFLEEYLKLPDEVKSDWLNFNETIKAEWLKLPETLETANDAFEAVSKGMFDDVYNEARDTFENTKRYIFNSIEELNNIINKVDYGDVVSEWKSKLNDTFTKEDKLFFEQEGFKISPDDFLATDFSLRINLDAADLEEQVKKLIERLNKAPETILNLAIKGDTEDIKKLWADIALDYGKYEELLRQGSININKNIQSNLQNINTLIRESSETTNTELNELLQGLNHYWSASDEQYQEIINQIREIVALNKDITPEITPYLAQLQVLRGEYQNINEVMQQLNKESEKLRKQKWAINFSASLKASIPFLNEMQGLMSNMGSLFEENADLQKAFAIMGAMLSILQAIAGALSQTGTLGPWGAAALAASIAATGVALIAQMKQINMSNAESQNIGGDTNVAAAVPNINANPISYTRNVLSEDEEEATYGEKDNKVYVVENDITTTQNRVRVRENNSSF